MNSFDYMFLTIICALNLSALIVAIILINHIDDRIYDIKQKPKEQEAVIRCKDCKYCGSKIMNGIKFAKCELKHNWMPQPNWFCADGEKRNDNA